MLRDSDRQYGRASVLPTLEFKGKIAFTGIPQSIMKAASALPFDSHVLKRKYHSY